MSGFSGAEEKDYVLLRDVKVEFRKNDDGGDNIADEVNGIFTLCFWLYIDNCAFFPSAVLVQNHPDVTSSVPFLWLDEKKRLKLYPLLFLHEEAPGTTNPIAWTDVPCASTEFEFPVKKWVHVGCEVLRDLLRLHVDGEIVGEKPLTCSIDDDFHSEALKRIYLACPDKNEDIIHGYVHGLDLMFPTAVVKNHYLEDPPVRLSIDYSSASEIEEDGGVWSIVGGKASCRRSFSLDVTLLDVFDCAVNKDLEVVASLLYADNEAPVENTADSEPPLLMSCDGVEYASFDRPSQLINGRASFRLKISQLSSKCDNRLFRIKFDISEIEKFPFLETLSPPIHCVSRSKNMRAAPQTCRMSSNRMNGCDSPGLGDGPMEIVPNIVREAKQSPSSKRVKLGNDIPYAMSVEHNARAWASNEDNMHRIRPVNHSGAENNSFAFDHNSKATNSDPKSMHGITSPISDMIMFKYCLGGPAERCDLLKEIAISATEGQLANFAEQVSLFSGCSHHRQQIRIAKRLIDDGIQAWTSISENNNRVLWENLVCRINQHFMNIARSNRSLTEQDFECLRKIAGCRDLVSQEDFERMWCWLYPVAFTLSQTAVNPMWNSLSPVWMQGFITKEEAESAVQGPGTFLLRFPTSRSWPHPDAGNLVVTYVGGDHKIHHRLLSLDFVYSYSRGSTVRPLHELLLQEPELSRLGKTIRSH
ncbi:hypothetical protein PHJA_002786300 [Phtheirospermum japonicum]|uniref:SH2 domain-containing protein n=1 Tax=Phtheirospermum japonicum TaxID=374723 RepID=A0A830D6Z9_9LAMI|nr:hypothetical protein PHJA_002786300 [Phtheirospermum japonicum]